MEPYGQFDPTQAQARTSYLNSRPPTPGSATLGASTQNQNQRVTIEHALEMQHQQLAQLHGVIGDLESKLYQVLEPVPSSGVDAKEPMDSPGRLLDRIAFMNRSIETAALRLVALQQRLQL